MKISQAVQDVLEVVPDHVTVVAAAKHRTPDEIETAIGAGIHHIGQNYVQEAEELRRAVKADAVWHLIGHLQQNKARRALACCDWIDSVDSLRLARRLDAIAAEMDRIFPVLVEINSGREANKTGFLPEKVDDAVRQIADLPHLKVEGVMTMGPRFGRPEDSRPYFVETRRVFERLGALQLSNVHMNILSMGMSNSYLVAIEEGANMVRLGTVLFGERPA